MKVYAIVDEIEGPCGHGMPGQPYYALQTEKKGDWFVVGVPYPLFEIKKEAEEFILEKEIRRPRILELEVKEGVNND